MILLICSRYSSQLLLDNGNAISEVFFHLAFASSFCLFVLVLAFRFQNKELTLFVLIYAFLCVETDAEPLAAGVISEGGTK